MLFKNEEELEDDIIYLFQLDNNYYSDLLNYFLGTEYTINLTDVSFGDGKKFLSREKSLELVTENGITAEMFFNDYGADINFYKDTQESKVQFASMNIILGGIGPFIRIYEFNDDGSFIKSYISANENWQEYPKDYKLSKIFHYKLYIEVNYYSADSLEKLGREKIQSIPTNNDLFLTEMGINSVHSNMSSNESLKKYDGKDIVSELLKVKETIEEEVTNDNRNSIIQKLTKEK